MRTIHEEEPSPPNGERGSALIIALALVMALTMLVISTQLQTVSQLKVSKTERDYERALQMAEAGANAYLNRMSFGLPAAGVPNAALVPDSYALPHIYSIQEFRAAVKAGTIPSTRLVFYPPGQTTQGYFAGHIGTPGVFLDIIAYGWSNGVIRRIHMDGRVFGIFDWAALWGMNPANAWTIGGDATIVGAAGGEGVMSYSNNNLFFDGPLVMCTPAARWDDATHQNVSPFTNGQVAQSAPNVPSGHVGSGVLANPMVKRFSRPIGFPTVDQAANDWAKDRFGVTTNAGARFFRDNSSYNDDDTGFRYLMRRADGTIYEWPQPSSVVSQANDYYLDFKKVGQEATKFLKDAGLTDTFYGLRVYPGNYYLTGIDMSPSDYMFLRTFNDADRSDSAVTGARSFAVESDPANPNPGMADERNVRFWIGHADKGADPPSRFEKGTSMEYPTWASRFRVYNASRGGVLVRGSASGPPFYFNVNMLNYNRDAAGYYGQTNFTSAVYLRGSLIAWSVGVQGGTTIEKQVPELSPEDKLTYIMYNWTELP